MISRRGSSVNDGIPYHSSAARWSALCPPEAPCFGPFRTTLSQGSEKAGFAPKTLWTGVWATAISPKPFRRSSAVEQLTVNQLVVGSIPTVGAIFPLQISALKRSCARQICALFRAEVLWMQQTGGFSRDTCAPRHLSGFIWAASAPMSSPAKTAKDRLALIGLEGTGPSPPLLSLPCTVLRVDSGTRAVKFRNYWHRLRGLHPEARRKQIGRQGGAHVVAIAPDQIKWTGSSLRHSRPALAAGLFPQLAARQARS